jgi:thiaminase/transcriptional activator TenA
LGLAGFDIFFTPNLPVPYMTPQGNRVPATRKKAIDMSLSDELFAVAEPHWVRQVQHPFVRGLSDGTLGEDRFIRWILQDYRYLKEYARVFAWAVAKADRLESMAWYSGVLDLTLNTEMELHREYAARFGISAADLEAEPMWPTTRAYTDFLVRTAADGDMLDLLGALLPCTWGYVYIAGRLAGEEPPEDPRYADWIQQYASPEFADALAWLRTELDRLARGIGKEKEDRIKEIFLTSTRYEGLFWDMCWRGESWDTQNAV